MSSNSARPTAVAPNLNFGRVPADLPPGPQRGGSEALAHGDQAIFTSVRCPTGEGYRIAASSLGVRAEEKKEITRRSPSHGGLCSTRADAVGLSAYPLPTGRYCVAYTQYGGVEPSARGGQTVYTHAVVLDSKSYRRFNCNPVRVHAALAEAIGDAPTQKPPSSLRGLGLRVPEVGQVKPGILTSAAKKPEDLDRLAYVVSLILGRLPTVMSGAVTPFSFLECLLTAVPLGAREKLALSVGLKYARARQLEFVMIDRDRGETQRSIKGHGIQWVDVGTSPPRTSSPYFSWLDLIRRWWREGRLTDLARLTADLDCVPEPGAMERIAAISDDMDRVKESEPAGLERLKAKYGLHRASNPAEGRLVQRLLGAVAARQAAL